MVASVKCYAYQLGEFLWWQAYSVTLLSLFSNVQSNFLFSLFQFAVPLSSHLLEDNWISL